MRCYNCRSKCHKCNGDLILSNSYIGDFHLCDVTYFKCEQCDNILLPEETIKKSEEKYKKIRDELISNFPISEFLSPSETAELLNITRQALHKNQRIKRGFIYSIKLAGKTYYLKKSVLLFKETGDGRFPLKGSLNHKVKDFSITVMVATPKPEYNFFNKIQYVDQTRMYKSDEPVQYLH